MLRLKVTCIKIQLGSTCRTRPTSFFAPTTKLTHHLSSSRNGITFGKKRHRYVTCYLRNLIAAIGAQEKLTGVRRRSSSTCTTSPNPSSIYNLTHKLSISIYRSNGRPKEEGALNSRLATRQFLDLEDRNPFFNCRCCYLRLEQ